MISVVAAACAAVEMVVAGKNIASVFDFIVRVPFGSREPTCMSRLKRHI
jgi:hypothetical protein